MTPWETAVCKRAVDTYGKEHQLIICMEEMAELTKELSKNMRGQDNLPHIAEEVADVEIMLEHVKVIFGIREDVTTVKDEKLIRLNNTITKETGTQDWNTSQLRRWLHETAGKFFAVSEHELRKPE